MPLVFTVAQLLEMSEGSVPEAFSGTIKTVFFPPRSGDNDKGHWTLQKVVITDGTKDIALKLSNVPNVIPIAAKGQKIHVAAGVGEKGLKGLKRGSYENKPEITIYDSATITIEGIGSGTVKAADLAPPAEKQKAAAPAPAAPPAQAAAAEDAPPPEIDHAAGRVVQIKGFNLALGKTVSALSRCYDAAIGMTKDITAKHPDSKLQFTTSDIKEIAMGLLIQTCWNQKPAAADDFPIRPFDKYDQGGNLIGNGTNGNGHAPAEAQKFT